MTPPSSIGHYKIISKIGEGGMGAVYRATDTKLNRDVAIKVLPAALSQDAARMARFEREAQVLASLNHPNIAAIYGVEDGAIVMELVDGSEPKGPLPVDTAIAYAVQIASGLEAAHEKGIIHRDLKPANIKVTADGVVKLLDFGLAKATEESPRPSTISPTLSPTLSLQMTQAGVILGTAAYMAPEQARGGVVDKRADIWAFGLVLLEMLTGVMQFHGDTVSDTLADVLRAPIRWDALPKNTPDSVRRLLERCLERDPKRRLRDIGEARIALSDPEILKPGTALRPVVAGGMGRLTIFAAVSLAVLVGLAAGFWIAARSSRSTSAGVTRLTITLPPGQVLTGGSPDISRDGRTVAYVARTANSAPHLYVRELDRFESSEIAGTENASWPFFSPDGTRIGFYGRAKLWVVSKAGGAPTAVADASFQPVGAWWGDDDVIYFVPALTSGILRIPSTGGKAQQVTLPGADGKGYAHVWPQYLSDSRGLMFSVWGGPNLPVTGGAVLPVGQQNWSHIGSSMWTPRYARSGHLIVGDHQGLMAAPFDPKRPQETHPHTFVVDSVYSTPNLSGSWFAVSDTGTLVYVSGDPMLNTVAWVDRSGAVTPVTDKPQAMADLALSPDGTRIAVDTEEALWVIDLRRGSKMRLTQDNETANFYPIWIRHGTQIIFASNRDGEWDLYTAPANGGPASKLLARKGAQFPQSEAADGTIMFSERLQGTATDLFTLSPGGSVAPFIVSPATKLSGQYSPDGRIVAYISDETGRDEVYLRLVAMPEEAVAVSTEGGGEPKWSPDGKELFYRRGDAFFVVNVNTGGGLSVGDARKLFEMPAAWGRSANRAGYAVSSDGKRFLILRPDPRAIPTQINVVTHWFDELKAKVPVR